MVAIPCSSLTGSSPHVAPCDACSTTSHDTSVTTFWKRSRASICTLTPSPAMAVGSSGTSTMSAGVDPLKVTRMGGGCSMAVKPPSCSVTTTSPDAFVSSGT